MLKLTYKELQDIVEEDFADEDRFEIIWNDIPVGMPGDTGGGKPRDYIEDDGRQYRYFEFKDTQTGLTYDFSYTFHPEWWFEFPLSFLSDPPSFIEFVEVSVINPPKPPVEPEPAPLTPTEIRTRMIFTPYELLEAAGEIQPYAKGLVPLKVIKGTKKLVDARCKTPCTIADIQEIVIPIAIQYKVDHKGLWQHMQGWSKYK